MTTSNSRVIAVNPCKQHMPFLGALVQLLLPAVLPAGKGNGCPLAPMALNLFLCIHVSPLAAFWIIRYPLENVGRWRILFLPVPAGNDNVLPRRVAQAVTLGLCSSGSAAESPSAAKRGQCLTVSNCFQGVFHFENIKHLQSHQLQMSLTLPKLDILPWNHSCSCLLYDQFQVHRGTWIPLEQELRTGMLISGCS